MENYFILLELPFDPPESDTNKISEAISKKQAQWSRDQSNPVKKAKASEYLAALENIKKVMLDPAARKQEAAKAKQIKDSKEKELEAKLSLYRAKGDELSEKDLKQWEEFSEHLVLPLKKSRKSSVLAVRNEKKSTRPKFLIKHRHEMSKTSCSSWT